MAIHHGRLHPGILVAIFERFALLKRGNCQHWHFLFLFYFTRQNVHDKLRERSGSVVEFLTRDRRAAGSSLTGVTALCP